MRSSNCLLIRQFGRSLCFTLSLLFFHGCIKIIDIQPAAPGISNIHGKMKLRYDPDTTISLAGTVITIDSTTFGAVTDSNGEFTIDSVPSGTYSLQFKHPGFSITSWSWLPIAGADEHVYSKDNDHPVVTTVLNSYLIERPKKMVSSPENVRMLDSNGVECDLSAMTFQPRYDEDEIYIVALLSDTDPHKQTPSIARYSYGEYFPRNPSTYTFEFDSILAFGKPLSHQSTVYLTLYFSNSRFTSPETMSREYIESQFGPPSETRTVLYR